MVTLAPSPLQTDRQLVEYELLESRELSPKRGLSGSAVRDSPRRRPPWGDPELLPLRKVWAGRLPLEFCAALRAGPTSFCWFAPPRMCCVCPAPLYLSWLRRLRVQSFPFEFRSVSAALFPFVVMCEVRLLSPKYSLRLSLPLCPRSVDTRSGQHFDALTLVLFGFPATHPMPRLACLQVRTQLPRVRRFAEQLVGPVLPGRLRGGGWGGGCSRPLRLARIISQHA